MVVETWAACRHTTEVNAGSVAEQRQLHVKFGMQADAWIRTQVCIWICVPTYACMSNFYMQLCLFSHCACIYLYRLHACGPGYVQAQKQSEPVEQTIRIIQVKVIYTHTFLYSILLILIIYC